MKSVTRIICGVLIVQIVFGLIGSAGSINKYVGLAPSLVTSGNELWRILTYPFGIDQAGAFISLLCFYAVGDEIEQFLGKKHYLLLLVMVALISGFVHLLFFYNEPYPELVGMMNMALFVLIGFFYLYPTGAVYIMAIRIRTWLMVSVVLVLVAVRTQYFIYHGAPVPILFGEGIVGLLLGMAFFHVRYQKYNILLSPIRSVERLFDAIRGGDNKKIPVRSSQRPRVVIPVSSVGTVTKGTKPKKQQAQPRQLTDEERLNEILDHINAKGYESLTEEEKNFLNTYSKKL